MHTLNFTTEFSRAITRCRYAVYGVVVFLVWMSGLASGDLTNSWLVPVTYLIGAPVLVHVLVGIIMRLEQSVTSRELCYSGRRVYPRSLMQWLFLVEWLALVFMLPRCGLSWIGGLCVGFVFLASNTALWGWRWGFWCSAGGVLLGLASVGGNPARSPGLILPWLDAGSVSATAIFMLTVCAVAHHQAQQLLLAGRVLKSKQQVLLRYLPKDLPAHLRLGAMQARHGLEVRRVWLSVAFIDLTGFTQATRTLPVQDLSNLLNEFMATTNALVDQWDGWVSKFLGDGVLCVFVAEHELQRPNAVAQAVHCMTQLPERVASLLKTAPGERVAPDLGITIGMASGHCYVGDWGGQARLDYTVIGTPVNLACRLQGAARPYGGLLLDAGTARLASPVWPPGPSCRLDLKGIGTVTAYAGNSCQTAQKTTQTVGCQR